MNAQKKCSSCGKTKHKNQFFCNWSWKKICAACAGHKFNLSPLPSPEGIIMPKATQTRQFQSVLHDPGLDRPVTSTYLHFDRHQHGRYVLVQGESGRFYADNLESAVLEVARYGKDHYDYSTVTTPVQVTVYPS